MGIDNTSTISGNTTREPELRHTQSGLPVANVSVAINRRWKDKNGADQEETSFVDVVLWGQLGVNAAESVPKGARVTVTGRLQQRSWEDAESGKTRSKLELVADDFAASLRFAQVSVTKNPKPGEASGHTADVSEPSPAAVGGADVEDF